MSLRVSRPIAVDDFAADGGLTALFAQTPVAMAVLEGRELRYSFANPKYQQIIGGRDPVGRRLIEMFPELAGSPIEAVIVGVYDTLVPFSATDLHIRFDSQGTGEIDNYYDLAYQPLLGTDGVMHSVLVVAVDVTERRAASEHERRIVATEAKRMEAEAGLAQIEEVFRQAPSFLAVYRGPHHVFAMANDAYYQLVGRGRDIIGKPLLEALPEVVGQGFDTLLDAVLESGIPFVARELPVRLARGTGMVDDDRVVSLTYLPLCDQHGTRVGVIAHGTDVTDSVLARREVERLLLDSERARTSADESAARADSARVEAEAANSAKAEFLAVMSHELRTPLNAIGGYAELLEMGIRGAMNDEQRQDLHRIQQSQRHLLGLIDQVLSHVRAGVAAVTYDAEDVNAASALSEAEALIEPQMRMQGVSYVVTPCDPTMMARADASKLQQILLNLLGNAIKFTPRGGQLTATCSLRDGVVSFSIADTGIGIAPDKLATIFEPFVQIDSSLTRAHPGVGLGLAISRDLARAMKGDLSVESTLGMGSRFTLTLPAA